MPINPDAVGMESKPAEGSWTSKDSLLYAVGVGAGITELQFTTENSIGITQRALPTQCVVLGGHGEDSVWSRIGDFNPAMLVHGEQKIVLHRELPVEGRVLTTTRIAGIYDKGKGAVVVSESNSVDAATHEAMFTNVMTAFIRGEGGWGGDRGPAQERPTPPDRTPDHTATYQTREDQALTYRLSGDRNPLHADPKFAELAGFPRPILHGLCTYGFTGRALLHSLCDSDPSRFHAMEGRFTSPVFPGEALTVKIWVDGSTATFQTCGPDGRVVLDNGLVTFS